MSFTQRLSAGVGKHLSSLKRMYNERVELAEARARKQLADAKTKTDREKIKLQLQQEKMAAKKELYEAQIATAKAKTAMEKARKEAGDLTISEQLGQIGRTGVSAYRGLAGTKPKKRATKRTTGKKTASK